MEYNDELFSFAARLIPEVIVSEEINFNPFNFISIQAMDKETKKTIAKTMITVPDQIETGCKTCHNDGQKTINSSGLSKETCREILLTHDKRNKTDLVKQTRKGNRVFCSSCHQSGDSEKNGKTSVMILSASIHGFHANYLTDRDDRACNACHASSPEKAARSFSGIHNQIGMNCTNCHGKLEDMAISLLTAEKKRGINKAESLMKHLKPRSVENPDEITPRNPWINEPDCLNCHIEFQPPETDESDINLWTKNPKELFSMRTDDAGVRCAACHGSAYAIYPGINEYAPDIENIPPLQYQKNRYPIGANKNCKVCHTIDMEVPIHHPNMLGMFRNTM